MAEAMQLRTDHNYFAHPLNCQRSACGGYAAWQLTACDSTVSILPTLSTCITRSTSGSNELHQRSCRHLKFLQGATKLMTSRG